MDIDKIDFENINLETINKLDPFDRMKIKVAYKNWLKNKKVERRKIFKKECEKKYRQRPEVQERIKKYLKEYRQRPEVQERIKKYRQRPEVQEKIKKYYQRPEVKERMKKYKKLYYMNSLINNKQ